MLNIIPSKCMYVCLSVQLPVFFAGFYPGKRDGMGYFQLICFTQLICFYFSCAADDGKVEKRKED